MTFVEYETAPEPVTIVVVDVDVGRGTLLVVLGRESELGEDDGDRVDDEDDESPSTVIVVELDNSEEVESIPLESAPHPASNVSAIAREAMRFIATRSDEP